MEGGPTGRTLDIELGGGQEVIGVDLDDLDPNPENVLDLLKEGRCTVWVWTKLATEYWRRGYLAAAERIAHAAVDAFHSQGTSSVLPPIYSLLANIQIAHARTAPKLIIPDARQDILKGVKTKEEYHKEAAQYLNAAERATAEAGENMGGTLSFLTRGIQQLATTSMDDALRSFEGVLAEKPTNIVALLGKARILYTRRLYAASLKIFQRVLELSPACCPDPRIGIGLCLWAMEHKEKAKAAWERCLEVNPNEWPAQLLLGLEAINASKRVDGTTTEEMRAQTFMRGTKLVEKAFNANQKSAAAANALCEVFLRKGSWSRALKLAERTIQFADTMTVVTEGNLRAGRVLHAEGKFETANKYFSAASGGQSHYILAAIGTAQIQIQNDELAAAIHTLDTLLQPPNPQRSLEATVILASLRAHPRPGVSSSDVALERTKARGLFDTVLKGLELEDVTRANAHITPSRTSRNINDDMDMHIEVARLWQSEHNFERVGKALREAIRISEGAGGIDPRLLNNLGALAHFEGNFEEAQGLYERALTSAGALGEAGESMATSILYNLGRVYEEKGEENMATEAYDKLLSRHPEYVDAKIRQAQILANMNRNNEAHDLLKQALISQNGNLNIRAFYTYFLIQTNSPKVAKDFVFATLKDHDKHDVYALCAAGWIMYHQARENRDPSPKATEDRRKGFQRTADFYEKALSLDPMCAFAAQGLAIVTAEDALVSLSGGGPQSNSTDDGLRRLNNARDALEVFAKVRESVNDGSVYFNMGHCYYARDEYDRAIESYETASTRFYHDHNVPVLSCLCRSWYAKANKDQSTKAMNTALRYAQMALHIQPNDKAVLYNIAMIQQKSAEMMFTIPPAKRTLTELQHVIEQGTHAQKLFASLASDKVHAVPYSREIADQRRKYGDNMLRKGEEYLLAQRQYEEETQARLDAARQKRQEERERQEALERHRMEELRHEAEILAEERRIAREQALEWTREVRAESDEERERKAKKARKPKADGGGSGDEQAPKKKRRGKLRKTDMDEPDEAVFSDNEETERPTKKRPRTKKVIKDEEDDEEEVSPKKKKIKSKETISDSDDEMYA